MPATSSVRPSATPPAPSSSTTIRQIEPARRRRITERLRDAAEIIGLRFLDHIVFGHERYVAYRKEACRCIPSAHGKQGPLPDLRRSVCSSPRSSATATGAGQPRFSLGGFACSSSATPARAQRRLQIVAPADSRIVRSTTSRPAVLRRTLQTHRHLPVAVQCPCQPLARQRHGLPHEYKPGAFKPAMKTKPAAQRVNTLYMDSDRGRVTVRQISGRRPPHRLCREEARIELGQKFGMIKFGSRTGSISRRTPKSVLHWEKR